MIIRRAILSDIGSIMQLIKAVVPTMIASGNLQWDDTYPNPEVFENDIDLDQLWIAAIDGTVGGVAAFATDKEPEYAAAGLDINEAAVVVHRLAVNPEHQGMGIAAALLQQAEQVAISKKINVLRVDTNVMNIATQKLFPKLGYVFAGEIGLKLRPGLRFYCYEKRLPVTDLG